MQLYNQLLQIEYSPITALNRTYVLSKVYGNEKAIFEAKKLQLTKNHLYFSLLGHLHTNYDNKKAIGYFLKSIELATTEKDKLVLQKKINKLKC